MTHSLTRRFLLISLAALVALHAPDARASSLVPSSDIAVGVRATGAVVSTRQLFPAAAAIDQIHFVVFLVDGNVWGVRAGIDEEPFPIFVSETTASIPAVAAAGDRFIVIYSTPSTVETAFVGIDGRVSPGGVIAESPALSTGVAFNGERFLAVFGWRAVMLDLNGAVVREIDLPAGLTANGHVSSITSDGEDFLVTLEHPFRVVMISAGGELMSTLEPAGSDGRAVFDGSRYLVIFSPPPPVFEQPELAGLYLDRSGQPSSEVFTIAAPARRSRIVSTSDGAVVVWQEGFDGSSVHALRLDRAGNPIDPQPVPLPADGIQTLTAGAGEIFLTYERRFDILPWRGSEFSISGLVLDGSLQPLRLIEPLAHAPHRQSEPSIASHDRITVVAWSELLVDEQRYAAFASFVTPEGQLLDPAPIRLSETGNQIRPSVALSFNGALIVMRHQGGGVTGSETSLRAVLVRFDGQVSPPIDIPLKHGGFLGFPNAISVAFNDGSFLVAWDEAGVLGMQGFIETRFARISIEGEPLDAAPILLANSTRPRVDSWGENYVVSSQSSSSIIIDLIDGQGRQIRRPFTITVPDIQGAHAIAVGGDMLLVTWPSLAKFAGQTTTRIQATLIDVQHELHLPPQGRARPARVVRNAEIFAISHGESSAVDPSAAFDSHRFAVVWREGGDVLGRLLSVEEQVMSEVFPAVDTPYGDLMPVLSGAAGRFWLAYERIAPDLGLGPSSRVFLRTFASSVRQRPVRMSFD